MNVAESAYPRTCGPEPLSGRFKQIALMALATLGIFRVSEYLSNSRLQVLTYHRVIPRDTAPGGRRPPNTLFADEFEAQMAFIASRFRVLDGPQLRAALEGGAAVPPYALAITFDDGYENNFSCALPILQRYGLHAVFFITTGLIETASRLFWFDRLDRLMDAASPDRLIQELRKLDSAAPSDAGPRLRAWFKTLPSWHQEELLSALEAAVGHAVVADGHGAINAAMNWDQVRALGQAGMSIGSHTVNHQILAAVDPEVVRMELVESRRRLEQETGQPCWLFAYPNGRDVDFTPQDEAAVRDAGYTCAFTQVVGSIGRDSSRFRLPRIPVPDSGDMNVFRSHLSGVRRVLDSVLG